MHDFYWFLGLANQQARFQYLRNHFPPTIMNKNFSFNDLNPEYIDAPVLDSKRLHKIIKTTLKKYQVAKLGKKMHLRSVLKDIQYRYPLTFTCATEPGLVPKEVISRLHNMVKGKITTATNIENDPMYGNLAHDLL